MVFFRLKIRLWDFMFFGCNEISLFPCEIFCCIIIWCYWRDVNSSYCDWRVQSGVWGWWWWCDVKMVGRWCLKNAEVVHAFCENVLLRFHAFWPAHMREWAREKGGGRWNICWEGAREVGFTWSLSLPSLPTTVFLPGLFRLLFLCCLWMNSVSFSGCCIVSLRDFMLFGPYEIFLWVHAF